VKHIAGCSTAIRRNSNSNWKNSIKNVKGDESRKEMNEEQREEERQNEKILEGRRILN
jgi:hypothetical protein